MELNDPVAVYTAGSNLDAHQISVALLAAGIQSQVIEDNSPAGIWVGGENSALLKSQVWVSQADVEPAVAIIQQFEAQNLQRFESQGIPVELHAEWIDATCDRCETVTRFAPIQKGTVVNCPHCFAFMDVGSDVDFDDWNVIDQEDEEDSDDESDDETSEEPTE